MRKLFKVVLAVALAAVMVMSTALAADTDLGISSNATITDAVNGAAAGSKLVVEVEYTEEGGSAGAGWGIGGLCTDGGWGVNGAFEAKTTDEPEVGDVLTFTFDLDAVKAAASGDINLNFYNGFAVKKAVISSPEAQQQDPPTQQPETPKTADTMTVVLFAGVAVVALVAVVASKKARA